MTGSLTLSGDPTLALHAATMQYVDNGLNEKLDLAGGTMTGSLLLAGDPTAGLQAATKQYVDQGLSLLGGRLGAPVATLVDLTAVASGTLADRQLRLVENTGAIFRYDVQSTDVPDGDGVLAPDDITPPAPGRWIKAQSATVAHNMLSSIQGGAPGEYLHLTNAEKNSYDAHLTDLGLHLTSAQNSLLDGISVTASEINSLTGITGNIQSQLNGLQTDLGYTPVNKAGDTMLGTLVLAGDPTAALHPVTKQYLEAYTVDCGTF
jgi:hypothetical protein